MDGLIKCGRVCVPVLLWGDSKVCIALSGLIYSVAVYQITACSDSRVF